MISCFDNRSCVGDFRICCDIAEVATSKREYDQAIRSYKEALSHDSSHVKVAQQYKI